MEVILLERIERLGQMGDVVRVKDGFARNYLLPRKKALRANEANREYFENQRVQLEAQNLERRKEAEDVGARIDGQSFVIIRQAGESGQLYGSVSTRDIAQLAGEGGVTITRDQVVLDRPIKSVGLHDVRISLHPEVIVAITVNVARSDDEAERQARGEVIGVDEEPEDVEEEAIAIDEVIEDEAAEQAVEELSGEEEGAEAADEDAGEADAETSAGEATSGDETGDKA